MKREIIEREFDDNGRVKKEIITETYEQDKIGWPFVPCPRQLPPMPLRTMEPSMRYPNEITY